MSKVMLITGARKGMGRSFAEYYLEKGYQVVGCSRGESDLEHEHYLHVIADVSDDSAVRKLVRYTKKEFGQLDVLLNNAGIASLNHISTSPTDVAHRVFDTNFFGTFNCTREAAKLMLRKKEGVIVNFSTVAVPLDLEGEAVYAASKAAVESFTQIAAKEFGGFGIRVNTVGPTPVPTDLTRVVPKNKLEELVESQAIKRMGTFEDVANVVDFFIDEKSKFITGQTVYLGGVMK